MKVVILDKNEAVVNYFYFLLKKIKCKVDIEIFFEEKKCLEYLDNKNDIDFIFVDEMFYENILDKNLDSFLIILSFDIKDLNIENRIYYQTKKDILPLEFKARFSIIKKLREYFLKEQAEKSKLTGVISYKEQQEEMATQKQLKLFLNELSMFYENNSMIETYFNSKDILSGDGVFTKRIDEDRYFVTIVDAMGKGLSASLTSANSVGFLSYVLKEFLDNNNFNFQKIVEKFIKYIQSILIENETLCFIIGYVENNSFTFVNFGMPPIYVDREKVRANNMPLSEWDTTINVDKIEFQNDILMYSDGLIECWTKDDKLYLHRLKELLPKFTFLHDILKDFKKYAIQSDDTTIIYLKKDNFKFNKIYEEKIKISIKNIDNFLKNVDIKNVAKKDKIEFILQELLMNSYEHSLLKLQNLKDAILRDNEIEIEEGKSIESKIVLYESDKFVKLEYSDNGNGFNIDILKTLGRDKLHGRGIKMIKAISDGFFYNYKGNCATIFLSKDD